MKQFFKEVWQTFSAEHWKEISQRPAGKGLGFFTKALFFAFIIMLLIMIPTFVKMPKVISEQLNKFDALQLSGTFTMTSPIKLPREEPVLIIDTSGAYTELTTERMLITKDTIFFRPLFRTRQLSTESLKDLKNNREQVKWFLAMLVFFLLPAILFWAYIAVWLKYFLLILVLSIILFILLDLTHWRRRWKEFFVIGCYVSLLPLLVEVIVGSYNTKLLVPVLNIAGLITLYLVPAVILAVLTLGAALCVYYHKK